MIALVVDGAEATALMTGPAGMFDTVTVMDALVAELPAVSFAVAANV